MEKINLNSILFNEILTREDILNHISQEDIYSHYIGEKIISGMKINSPLRDDNVPSFGFFYHKNGEGTLMFNDLATKDCGDCFVFVCKFYGLGIKEALRKIAFDFKLSDLEISAEHQKFKKIKKVTQKKVVDIGVKKRQWALQDKTYWTQFGIKKQTLIRYNVTPIQYIFFNKYPIKLDSLAYAYLEFKDKIVSYKIYQPFDKKYKWINNANYTIHQGYTQLPKSGDLLIITKSLKDVMSIYDVMGLFSVGLQSESIMMKSSVMEEYKSRFKKVVCLFDNDKAGKDLSEEFSLTYNIPYFFMPEIEGVTDFSDLVKVIGIEQAKKKFKEEFNKINR